MDCDSLTFSQEYSEQRIARAEKALGKVLVQKILAFALFLLGVDRASIVSLMSMPAGTVRSLVRSFNNNGIGALLDRRTKTMFPKQRPSSRPEPFLETDNEHLKINLGDGGSVIDIPITNHAQQRVVLLSLLNGKVLKCSDVASAIGLSEDRTNKLARELAQNDVEAITDQRRGQQKEFLFTPQLKSELIQQFVIDIVSEGRTSGKQLAQHLEERCQITLSSRTILHHLSKLGLNHIKTSLPLLLEEAKKKSSRS